MTPTPLSASSIARIRRERLAPERTQWDYLHLYELLQGLRRALASLPSTDGPALDLYCGTQPYREMIPWRPLWGLDRDLHLGKANIVGAIPLPFRDASFRVILCTQALQLTDDPPAVVAEMRRVLEPGGYVVITTPHVYRREMDTERKLRRRDMQRLFDGWDRVRVSGAGGVGTGWAFVVGKVLAGAARRGLLPRRLLSPAAHVINTSGRVLDGVLRPLAERWPAILILVARRPVS
jgi:SAM-dependent methyltransferase